MQEVAGPGSLVERALVDAALHRPVHLHRLPVPLLSREQKAAELVRVQAVKAMAAAYEAELVLGLAEDSPDDDDPPPGTPGARSGSWKPDPELPGVSEFFLPELAMILNCGRLAASTLAHRAWTWRESLPGTWAALAAGELDEYRARVLAEVLQHTDPALARRVEARLLPDAPGLTAGKLRNRALQLLLELDPDAAGRRKEQAQRRSDVRVHPRPEEGMATLTADLPTETAAACHDVLDRLAQMLQADGDPRPIGQLRTVVLTDLIQRPWDEHRPAVTAHLQLTTTLTALAGDSAQCGEVSGLPITAAHLRELLTRLDALGLRPPEDGSVTLALTEDDGTLRATGTLDHLRRIAARGCSDHADQDCGCAVLDRPAATDAYTPTAAQQRFVRARDRTCRMPTCGQRVGATDANHLTPHARGGPTDCANLCCLCRSHHRLKTFARGWRFAMSDDGVLTVTTPSGITRTTRAPGMRPPRPTEDPPRDGDETPPLQVE
ncbi:MAG TPA: DUF222 domain-containing protein, partial [Geodermatophilus sp.]|nr:DUF222 domain-containing protein [Geodermatophilus sp.]